MALHEELYPLIVPEVLGCPTPTVDQAINRAAWDFCQDSLAWQVDLDYITARAGIDTYELELPCDALLVVITLARLDGMPLGGIVPGALRYGTTALNTENVKSTGHSTPSWQEVRVHPVPAQTGRIEVRAALKPKLTVTELPCLLVSRYGDALAEGAKFYLKRMAGKAWEDQAGSAQCFQFFRKLIAEARITAEVERTRGPLRVTQRRFC